jgi:uncharacterized cupredoxin-like copper-binding protein
LRLRVWTVSAAGSLALAAYAGSSAAGAAETPTNAAATAQRKWAAGARVVKIQALDTLRFDPATVTVKAGESVCFVVTNLGKVKHELVVGDRPMQAKHEKEMSSRGGMHPDEMGEMPEFELDPGETNILDDDLRQAGEPAVRVPRARPLQGRDGRDPHDHRVAASPSRPGLARAGRWPRSRGERRDRGAHDHQVRRAFDGTIRHEARAARGGPVACLGRRAAAR